MTTLGPWEEITIVFQASFPLQSGLKVYVGVLEGGINSTSLVRWDRYTTVLPSEEG